MDLNYLEDLKISLDNIHEIVDTHAVTAMRYHDLYSNKLDELNEQGRKIKIKEAELKEKYAELYLRNKKSGEKITEKENDSMILTHIEYKNKQVEYFNEVKQQIDLEKEVNVLVGIVKSMQNRKNMIEVKRDLLINGFYSEPRQNTVNRINDRLNK